MMGPCDPRLESRAAQDYNGPKDTKRMDASRSTTMANPAPVVGKWYARPGGDSFEIVAFDADDGTIEIQYFDGTIEELDVEDWREEQILPAEPPEDWTGSVDGARRQPARRDRSRRSRRLQRVRTARRAGRKGRLAALTRAARDLSHRRGRGAELPSPRSQATSRNIVREAPGQLGSCSGTRPPSST
jgi:hypothetical protein